MQHVGAAGHRRVPTVIVQQVGGEELDLVGGRAGIADGTRGFLFAGEVA